MNMEKVAERVYYESSGGLTVSGLLFRPAEGSGPCRPSSSTTPASAPPAISATWPWHTRQGISRLQSRFPGSGMSQGSHEGAKGEVDDVIAAIDYMESQASSRTGVSGSTARATAQP